MQSGNCSIMRPERRGLAIRLRGRGNNWSAWLERYGEIKREELDTVMVTSFNLAQRQLAETARGISRRVQGGVFNEMAAARRSFNRSIGKFEQPVVDKPIAILTAWRGELLDPNGQPYPEAVRHRLNDKANELLKANIRRRGLSFYPVVGAGQELLQGITTMNKENSFIVQPVSKMDYDVFRTIFGSCCSTRPASRAMGRSSTRSTARSSNCPMIRKPMSFIIPTP